MTPTNVQPTQTETFRTLQWAHCWGMFLGDARRPTNEELQEYLEWYRPLAMYAVGQQRELEHFRWTDLDGVFGDRKADGSFPGCDNAAWILSPAEEAAIIRIEEEREAVAAAKRAKDKAERDDREIARKAIECTVLRRYEDQGEEPIAIVQMRSRETGETLEFSCRNIFDFGYVVNPRYSVMPGVAKGGIAVPEKQKPGTPLAVAGRGADSGWYWDIAYLDGAKGARGRDLTEFEAQCVNYLCDFPPISDGMRM